MAGELNAKRFLVSGVVQGVGFRFFAVRAAQRLGLAGYTRNLRDGRVEVYAVGDEQQLTSLHNDLEKGPRGAIVSAIADEPAEIIERYTDGFSIEFEP